MDPTACLNRMLGALQEGDHAEAYQAAQDLLAWIGGGGFPPRRVDFTNEEWCDLTALICYGVMAGCRIAARVQS